MKARMLVTALLATIMAVSAALVVWAVPVSAASLPSLEERITAADLHWSRRSQAGVTEIGRAHV